LFQGVSKKEMKAVAKDCGLTTKYITQALNRYA